MCIHAVCAIGEFGHVGAADNDGPGRAQTGDCGGINGGRRRMGEHFGARARYLTLDIEKVLDRNRNARNR